MLSRATSTLLLILMLITPRHINAQEKKIDIKTLSIKITLYVAKDEKDKPTTSTMRFAKDGTGNLYYSLEDNLYQPRSWEKLELILADGFVYIRKVGADSDSRDWMGMSINTAKAIYGHDLSDVTGRIDFFESSNMQRQGTATVSATKTRVSVNNKPITVATDSGRDLVNALLKGLPVNNKPITATTDSVTDVVNALNKAIADGVRKVEIREFDAETNELVVSITVRVFAINSRIVIKAPKLPDKPRDPYKQYLFFNHEHCEASPDRPCQKNEIILKWNAGHVKNAVGVILFREDGTRGRFVRLRVSKEIKGTFTQTLCEPTRFRIVAIDKRRRPLRKTVDTMEITDADLEKCP